MITVTTILISHSIDCKRNLKVVGNRKLEIIKTNIKFDTEKKVRDFWRYFAKERQIDKMNIDFYTIGDSCILK